MIKLEFKKYSDWETKMARNIVNKHPAGILQLIGQKLRDDL
jgi:hypothetical protein